MIFFYCGVNLLFLLFSAQTFSITSTLYFPNCRITMIYLRNVVNIFAYSVYKIIVILLLELCKEGVSWIVILSLCVFKHNNFFVLLVPHYHVITNWSAYVLESTDCTLFMICLCLVLTSLYNNFKCKKLS